MSPTPEQKSAVERLYENEAIIDNLTSDLAQPILEWAEQQILAGVDAEAVVAAVRTANESGAQDATVALAAAQQALSPTVNKATTSAPASAPAKPASVTEPPGSGAAPPLPEPAKVTSEPALPTPNQASPAHTNEPPPVSHPAQRKANRALLHRLMGWIKSYRM